MLGKKIIGVELGRPGSMPVQIKNNRLTEKRDKEKLSDTQKEAANDKRDSMLDSVREKTTSSDLDLDSIVSAPRRNVKTTVSDSRDDDLSLKNQSTDNLSKAHQLLEKFEKSHEVTNLFARRSEKEPFFSADTDAGRKASDIQKFIWSSRFFPENNFQKDTDSSPAKDPKKKSGKQ